MQGLQQSYANLGIACRLTYRQGGTSTLDVEDATYSYVIDSWEFMGNDEARDIWSHPTVMFETAGHDGLIALIRQHLENQDSVIDVFGDGTTAHPGEPALAPFAGGMLPDFYLLYQRGSTTYRKGQYVLRHRTNAPARWTANIADFGVEQIYQPAQLLSEASSPALWIFPLPPRIQYKIAHMTPPAPQPGYLWGWLKGTSTETTGANNRIDIVQEYTLEQWSTALYDPY